MTAKPEINYFPHIIFPNNILGLEVTMQDFKVYQVNICLNNLGDNVNGSRLVKFSVGFQVVIESAMMAVLENQIISRCGFERLVTLDDVGVGQTLVNFQLELQVFTLLVTQPPQIYHFQSIRLVTLILPISLIHLAAIPLT